MGNNRTVKIAAAVVALVLIVVALTWPEDQTYMPEMQDDPPPMIVYPNVRTTAPPVQP